MSGPAPIFREIHRLRRFAEGLQEQLGRIPRQLKAHQARLAKQEQALRDAQETVKRLKVTANDKEKALKTTHDKMARFEKQLNEASSKKEYDALQMEIAHAKVECSKLEDEILAALTEAEEKAAGLPEIEKTTRTVKDEVARVTADSAPRKADLEAQLAETLAKLKVVEKTIPPDLLPQYNRSMNALGADGLAVVHDRICDNCHTEITFQAAHELKEEMFVLCRSCGRILYLPEAPPPGPEEED